MIVHDVDQRSDAWRALRAGRLTGACAADILAVRKKGTGELACRRDLRLRLVCERLTGLASDDLPYLPKDMQRGVDAEHLAFARYEAITGQLVRRVGFVAHDTLQAGSSPDGVVGDFAGVIELKCPRSTTHLAYLQHGVVPDEYRPQIAHNLWLTGAAWCDFVSFDDRLPLHLQVFRVRVPRDEGEMVSYEFTAAMFLSEVDDAYAALAKVPEMVAA